MLRPFRLTALPKHYRPSVVSIIGIALLAITMGSLRLRQRSITACSPYYTHLRELKSRRGAMVPYVSTRLLSIVIVFVVLVVYNRTPRRSSYASVN